MGVTAMEALYYHFQVNKWELSHDYLLDLFSNTAAWKSIWRLEREYDIDVQKWYRGEQKPKRSRLVDTWTITVHTEPDFHLRQGKYPLPKALRNQDANYTTPCMIPIRDIPGAVCESGEKCAQGGHCPIAKHIPWYQQDHRQEARQALRRLGYRKEWRFQL